MCLRRLDAPFGTEDNPVVVPSEHTERIVGVADPDDDSLVRQERGGGHWGGGSGRVEWKTYERGRSWIMRCCFHVTAHPPPSRLLQVWWGVIEDGQPPKQIIEGGEFFVLKKLASTGHH